ncbi:MAG: hypothetical protein OM95_07025 [Bdellovibrio sp. ArHS]|uniref:hypothetical protein n=1 Tax=Bdellovibrio sp. ArHS TaxID=1569284 RepID=UPI00058324D7|nr:hypothetical protein [Bdellovibrio sp. ArHS]KHD88862.1 MAG: hypothetical protein OM95_07025 [Bdellovibrio sp. ArHS]
MTEEAKKRMEAIIEDLYSKPRGRRIAEELYKAGMQDPDAGKVVVQDHLGLYERIGRALKDTGVPLTSHEMAEMRQVIRSYTQIKAENKKLRGALEQAKDDLFSCADKFGYVYPSYWETALSMFENARKALSSGGEG